MNIINLTTDHHTYPIYIGQSIYSSPELLASHIRGNQVMIVSNDVVMRHYGAALQTALSGYQCDHVLLPDGEEHKTLDTLNRIFDALLARGHRRDTTLIALGGGIVGDITGFAAATYQRGVPFIQIPTTSLAQADASVGGKTGVNHPLGKNMIGAFHQPSAVFIDVATLVTLPEREYRAGMAEIIKHAAIRDNDFFTQLIHDTPALIKKDPDALIRALSRSVEIKRDIVQADVYEQLNIRQLLNFGHTFAHAIETETQYAMYLHGEAVAIGMCMAANLSHQLGSVSQHDVTQLTQLLHAHDLPTHYAGDTLALLPHMLRDKKNRKDAPLQLILLEAPGKAVVKNVNADVVSSFLTRFES